MADVRNAHCCTGGTVAAASAVKMPAYLDGRPVYSLTSTQIDRGRKVFAGWRNDTEHNHINLWRSRVLFRHGPQRATTVRRDPSRG